MAKLEFGQLANAKLMEVTIVLDGLPNHSVARDILHIDYEHKKLITDFEVLLKEIYFSQPSVIGESHGAVAVDPEQIYLDHLAYLAEGEAPFISPEKQEKLDKNMAKFNKETSRVYEIIENVSLQSFNYIAGFLYKQMAPVFFIPKSKNTQFIETLYKSIKEFEIELNDIFYIVNTLKNGTQQIDAQCMEVSELVFTPKGVVVSMEMQKERTLLHMSGCAELFAKAGCFEDEKMIKTLINEARRTE